MTEAPETLLSADSLGRTVDGRTLWADLSFDLEAGECLVLSGPSGSGKTLLLRTLIALDPVESGTIRAFGRPQGDWSLPELRRRVLLLPQDARLSGRTSGETVRDVLAASFDLKTAGDRSFSEEDAASVLTSLGRSGEFLDAEIDDLSGGERQLAALARALLIDPDILLLDEPTAHLDPDARQKTESRIADWLRSGEHAAIWTTHDDAQAGRVERGGRLRLGGTPE